MPDVEYTPDTAQIFELAYYGALGVTADLDRDEFKAMINRWIGQLLENPKLALSEVEHLNLSVWEADE